MTAHRRALHAFFTAALALGMLTAAVGFAGAAWAHATRIAGDPAENSELPTQVPSVSATFNEQMQAQFAAMTVIGPDGTQWSDGDPVVDGAVITVAVRPGGPAGEYTVNYRATSADGHVVTGSWTYRVLAGAAPAPAQTGEPAPAQNSSSASPSDDNAAVGVPAWPFVLAATVVVAGGAIWAVRRRS